MDSASSRDAPNAGLIFAALIAIQLLFGAGYVVSKVLVGIFPPMVWASIRISISAMIMLGVALGSGRPSPKGWNDFFKPLIGFSLLGVVINQSSFLVGLRFTTSTNSAILNTLIPVFTLLLVILRRVEVMNWSRALGFLLALAGVLSIRHIEDFHFANQTVIGDLLTILNCLSFACFLVFGKAFMGKHDKIWTTTWLFIYGSIGITIL
ncbi:EamA family transporter, partial [bacterium]|nr:EamA family transporter [bacterium]